MKRLACNSQFIAKSDRTTIVSFKPEPNLGSGFLLLALSMGKMAFVLVLLSFVALSC